MWLLILPCNLGKATLRHVPHSSGAQEIQELREHCVKDKALLVSTDPFSLSTSITHLRWQVQRKVISIPKSITPSRILQNIQVLGDGVLSFLAHWDTVWLQLCLAQRQCSGIPTLHTKLVFLTSILHPQVFDFTFSPEEMKQLDTLNKNWRYIVPLITVSIYLVLELGNTRFATGF